MREGPGGGGGVEGSGTEARLRQGRGAGPEAFAEVGGVEHGAARRARVDALFAVGHEDARRRHARRGVDAVVGNDPPAARRGS